MSRILRYTNPQPRPDGVTWKCAVCGGVYNSADEARACAERDHERKTKR